MGGLDCVVVDDLPEGGKPSLLVVLCHGFGAGGDDLVSLGGELLRGTEALAGKVRFVFPAAPLSLAEYGYGDARAWWLIDMMRLQRLQQGGPDALKALREEIPEGLAKARKLLLALVDELSRTTGLPLGKIVLGGFSQGAMLATDVALRLEEAPAALVAMSGTLLCEGEWRKRAPLRKGLAVFQSHGRQDLILPFANATALKELLEGAGLTVEFLPFNGPHTIPAEALEKIGALLSKKL